MSQEETDVDGKVDAASQSARRQAADNRRAVGAGLVLGMVGIGVGVGVALGIVEASVWTGLIYGIVGFVGSYVLIYLLFGPLQRLTMWLLQPILNNMASMVNALAARLKP